MTRPSPDTPGTEPPALEPASLRALAYVYAVLGAVVVAFVAARASLFPTVGDYLAGAVLVATLAGLFVVLLRQELGLSAPTPERYYAPPRQAPTFRIVDRPPYDWQREERRGTSE